jgi:mycothiol system anti-sigma-R factor
MDCSGIANHFSPLLDGELEREKAERVRAHLAECRHCNKSFQDHMAVKRLLSQKLLFEKAPPGLRSGILDRLDSPRAGDFFPLLLAKIRSKPILASGTAVTAVVGALAYALFFTNPKGLPPLIAQVLRGHATAYHAALDIASEDVGEIARGIGPRVRRNIGVPDLKSKWCFLLGARACPLCGNPGAEMRYLHPAGSISFFLVSHAGERTITRLRHCGKLKKKRIGDRSYLYCERTCGRFISWWEGDDIFTVTSDVCLPSAFVFEVAREIRQILEEEH